jgi:MoxR-like ATPase
MSRSVDEINRQVEESYPAVVQVVEEVSKVMVGQRNLIEKLLIGLLCDGHILVEGVPGLAKTTAIKCLAATINATFSRIQFTPDLLPADLIGTQIYSPKDGSFSVKKGPLFGNIILADEINRAPAKVQSALLEAMQERQVTIADETFTLPAPFLVMATQNPVEQEGTYPLPEAQVDRFMLKVTVDYPSKSDEIEVMKRLSKNFDMPKLEQVLTTEKIEELSRLIDSIFVDEKLYDYVADLVFATRNPELYGLDDIKHLIEYGASPRASINLIKAAKGEAFLKGRGFVTPQDIKTIGHSVMRHRLIVSYEAEAQNMSADDILVKIFDQIDVP